MTFRQETIELAEAPLPIMPGTMVKYTRGMMSGLPEVATAQIVALRMTENADGTRSVCYETEHGSILKRAEFEVVGFRKGTPVVQRAQQQSSSFYGVDRSVAANNGLAGPTVVKR